MHAVDQVSIHLAKSEKISRVAIAALLLGFSIAAIVPCVWHKNVINGDLGSHLYNAWLAIGVERGEYPGLYFERVHTNILFDFLLTRLISSFPPATAERLALSTTVLIFFWGTFAAVRALSGERAWAVTPLILILTHGWALQIGFMNFHLATGLALFALALLWNPSTTRVVWNPSTTRVVLSCLLLALAAMAQPLPAVWVALAILYKTLYMRCERYRTSLLLAAIGMSALCAVAFRGGWFSIILRTTGWDIGQLRHATGADQALAYGPEYELVAVSLLALSGIVLAQHWRREGRICSNSLITHLWILLAVGTFLVPDGILFRGYTFGYYFISQRISALLAVVGIAVVAAGRPHQRFVLSFMLVAALFFAMLYGDTRRLNTIQEEFYDIVQRYPPGQRFVTDVIDWHADTHAPFLQSMLGRACVDRCLDYGNYEVSTRQFRIRARGPNPFVRTDPNRNPVEEFRLTNPELPLNEIEWCGPAADKLCVRETPPASSRTGTTR
jgi:hypothetical protein